MKFSKKDFFSICDQMRRELRIWLHLLKKPLMENFIYCAAEVENVLWKGFTKESAKPLWNILICSEFPFAGNFNSMDVFMKVHWELFIKI